MVIDTLSATTPHITLEMQLAAAAKELVVARKKSSFMKLCP